MPEHLLESGARRSSLKEMYFEPNFHLRPVRYEIFRNHGEEWVFLLVCLLSIALDMSWYYSVYVILKYFHVSVGPKFVSTWATASRTLRVLIQIRGSEYEGLRIEVRANSGISTGGIAQQSGNRSRLTLLLHRYGCAT
jgi:hypothetical protein